MKDVSISCMYLCVILAYILLFVLITIPDKLIVQSSFPITTNDNNLLKQNFSSCNKQQYHETSKHNK